MHAPTHPEESCVSSRIACSVFSVFIATDTPLKAKGDEHRTRHTALPWCKRGPAHGFPAQAAQQPASLLLAGEGSWLELLVDNTQTTYSQRGQTSTARQQPVVTITSTQKGTHTHQTECKSELTAGTYCDILQRTSTRCKTLQHTAMHCKTLQCTVRHCNILQHTATHCNTLQHIESSNPPFTHTSPFPILHTHTPSPSLSQTRDFTRSSAHNSVFFNLFHMCDTTNVLQKNDMTHFLHTYIDIFT